MAKKEFYLDTKLKTLAQDLIQEINWDNWQNSEEAVEEGSPEYFSLGSVIWNEMQALSEEVRTPDTDENPELARAFDLVQEKVCPILTRLDELVEAEDAVQDNFFNPENPLAGIEFLRDAVAYFNSRSEFANEKKAPLDLLAEYAERAKFLNLSY